MSVGNGMIAELRVMALCEQTAPNVLAIHRERPMAIVAAFLTGKRLARMKFMGCLRCGYPSVPFGHGYCAICYTVLFL